MRKTAILPVTRTLCFVILLLSCCVNTVSAQNKLKFDIIEFREDPTDLSANNPEFQKYDASGNRYSIIKVTSDNPNDDLSEYTFDFGMLNHTSEMHDDVLWLYVQQKARKVTITRKGYATVTKDLPQAIKAGANYVMRLSSETPVIHMQMVHFNVKPADSEATILIRNVLPDSEEEKLGDVDKDGSLAKNLPFGTYTYTITSANYYREDGRITLNDENKTLVENVTLKPRSGVITLNAPTGVEIYVNGEKKGVGTWTGRLKSGAYTIEGRKPNYLNSKLNINVADNDTQTYEVPELTPIIGILSVTSTPVGATIYIDDQYMGETPKNASFITGKHTVKIVKDGYNTEECSAEILEKQTPPLHFDLKNVGKMGIGSSPAGATLAIDGKSVGVTPYIFEGGIGEHSLSLQYDGYLTANKKVSLRSMNDSVFLRLRKMHIKPTDFYAEVGVEVGEVLKGVSTSLGCNLHNFNIQADFTYAIHGLSRKVFYLIDLTDDTYNSEYTCRRHVKPQYNMGIDLGYRIIASTSLSITPQLGYRHIIMGNNFGAAGYNSGFTVGARLVYAFSDHIGLSLTPRYIMKVAGADSLKKIGETVPGVDNLGCGFVCRLALNIAF